MSMGQSGPEAMQNVGLGAGVRAGGGETDARAKEYLFFTCCQIPCAVELHELREVVRTVPESVPLPFSPPWLLGVFSLRTEILGLVDPAPMLLGSGWVAGHTATHPPAATLIAGGETPLLGLAVESVGEIVQIAPHEIVPLVAPDQVSAAPSYVRGRYHPTGAPYPRAVVDLAPFVAAVVRTLDEGANHA